MEYTAITLERGTGQRSGIATLTLSRPHVKNALNDEMWGDLQHAFDAISPDPSVRALIITGAGGAFCSGADLSPSTNGSEPPHQLVRMRRVSDVALALHRLPMPVIAKVVGVAAGAGCNLALGCDLIVASDSARFSEIFARRGLTIDFGGSWLLPRLVGLHKAKELALLADIISAEEAERIGIVNRVVPVGEIDAFVDDWALRLASGPPLALRMTKQLLNQSTTMSFDQALESEGWTQTVNISATTDGPEAMQAFVDKRPAVFMGR